jgi:hypothetical protein
MEVSGREPLAAVGSAPDERTITEAYIYLLGRALVIRQEHTDLREPGVAYNSIKYNPLGSADFVNPNFDVAYLEAWFAADVPAGETVGTLRRMRSPRATSMTPLKSPSLASPVASESMRIRRGASELFWVTAVVAGA